MKVLIDLNHPAHVHLFRNFISYLKSNGHFVLVTASDKDLTLKLLNLYNINAVNFKGFSQNNLLGFIQLIKRDFILFKYFQRYRFDFAFGTSTAITHISSLTSMESFIFNEDDDDIVPITAYLSYPFATKIIIPDCLRYKKWMKKRVIHNSYHELAYLHPNNFKPNPKVLNYLGIKPNEKYFIVRLSALKAHHDKGAIGLTKEMQKDILNFLQIQGKVFITSEYELDNEFKKFQFPISPELIHHAMFYATMVIGDSQTMIAEAAVLGTPAIRYNSFVGKISYLEELEHKYELTFGFKPGQEGKMIQKIKNLIKIDNLKEIWYERKKIMLKEKCDLNQWMIDYFEKLIKKDY
ncbi:MAG: DUF354 domain-containing protein [Candidatus Kapabacteria bacterium]|nr:DUF354 domain-containing protein [Candidatus Kapabacteria bacterium]